MFRGAGFREEVNGSGDADAGVGDRGNGEWYVAYIGDRADVGVAGAAKFAIGFAEVIDKEGGRADTNDFALSPCGCVLVTLLVE
jgi:hypothetical protein